MAVAERGDHIGALLHVFCEGSTSSEGTDVELRGDPGKIFADLRLGAEVAGAQPLKSNENLACRGVVLTVLDS